MKTFWFLGSKRLDLFERAFREKGLKWNKLRFFFVSLRLMASARFDMLLSLLPLTQGAPNSAMRISPNLSLLVTYGLSRNLGFFVSENNLSPGFNAWRQQNTYGMALEKAPLSCQQALFQYFHKS